MKTPNIDKPSLGDRMKTNYENVWKITLPKRMPVIIRLDGKAFHTLTRGLLKPFDDRFISCMNRVAIRLCENIQGAQIAYVQSDEISILVHNYKKLNSQSWFGNEIQKMVSISAGMASAYFSNYMELGREDTTNIAMFDSRVFVLPENEVCNAFIWRQQDWERNSIQMLAQSLYSHKELYKKSNVDMQEMCFQKGKNWNDLPAYLKRGRCVIKKLYNPPKIGYMGENVESEWIVDEEIPIFSQDRNYIEKYLAVEEE